MSCWASGSSRSGGPMADRPALLEVRVTAEEPLALGVVPQSGNVVDSWAHVPGSVLRGALAAAWIAEHGPPNAAPPTAHEGFLRLFEGEVRYGRLLADGSAIEPLSVRRCKYRPRPGCRQTAEDLAADHNGDPPARLESCPACGGPLALGKGRVVGVRLEEVGRTELDDDETAKQGNLFTRRQLPAGTVLRGRIAGADPWLAQPPERIWLGGRRSTGGRARLAITPASPTPARPRTDGKILLRLEAPAILVDRATRPLLDLPEDELSETLDTQVRVERRWLRPTLARGWHAASGLPKPVDHALAAGSTFLLSTATGTSPDPAALSRLAEAGIGLRRAEGFGEVAVNPPPWTPPQPAVAAAATSRAADLVRSLVDSGHAQRLRPWLLPHLKTIAEQVELGQPPRTAAILEQRRLRGLPPSTVEAVGDLLALQEPELLRDAVTLLEDPG